MEKMYYYRNGDTQIGPVSIDQMRGAVTPETYVWAEGMANWQTVGELPELMSQLGLATVYQAPSVQQPTISYSNNVSSTAKPPKPDNHLILAIISALICQILGIIAVIMAVLSDQAYTRGDYDEAVKKAKTVKTLSLIGIIGTVVFIVLYVLFFVILASAGALQSY